MSTIDEAAVDAEVERRMQMPYAKELVRDEDGSYFAHVVEFPGCMTVGATEVEALEMLDDAMRAWLEVGIEAGDAIPEPARSEAISGKFNVRVAKSLHRDLVRRAEREGVSLNAWIVTLLSRGA
jgi:antitoxin HicB